MMTTALPASAQQFGPGPSPGGGGSASNPLTLGTQDSSQGSLTLTGPASGSYGGALTLNNTGSSGAPSVTLFNGSWFQSGGPVPTFRPNTAGDHVALDLSANGASNSTWIDACSTDVAADAAAHSGTLENYNCLHMEGSADGNVRIYNNVLISSVFQTPGTMYLNQQQSGSPSPNYGPVDIPGALTVGNGETLSGGSLSVTVPGTARDGIILTGTNGPAYTLTDGSHPFYIGLATTGGYYTAQTAAGDTGILVGNPGSSSNALHISTLSSQNDTLAIMANGDVQIGDGTAISTSATGGFLALETMNGTPSGTPANHATGFAQCVVDYTDGKLECYYNGGWNHLSFASGS